MSSASKWPLGLVYVVILGRWLIVRWRVRFVLTAYVCSALMLGLEAKLGPSSEALSTIQREMEKDYYNADSRLVDPLLAR